MPIIEVTQSAFNVLFSVTTVSLFISQSSHEALLKAGMVLRYRMSLNQSPKLVRDRRLGNQIVKRCFVGSEAIDWLKKISQLVHGRFHAIAMLQALLEEGVITGGRDW